MKTLIYYDERYTSDFKYVALFHVYETSGDMNNGCEFRINIYETNVMFRDSVEFWFEKGDWVPNVFYNSKYDDFELPLENMRQLRSIILHDQIRAYPCPLEATEGRESILINWIENVEPILGFHPSSVLRPDTAFLVNIRFENYLFYTR